MTIEVCKPKVDNAGYDIVVEAAGVIRHVQLKSSYLGGKTATQKVHLSLGSKPSGCVVWVYFDPATVDLGPFYYFGSDPAQPLPQIDHLRMARHTKGDKSGFKAERPNLRVVNKGAFTKTDSIDELFSLLFGSVPTSATLLN